MPANRNGENVDPQLVHHIVQDATAFVDGLNIEMDISQAAVCLGLVLGGVALGGHYATRYSPRQIEEAVRSVRAKAKKAFDAANIRSERTAAKN